MVRIRIEMEGGTTNLTAIGGIYWAADLEDAKPLHSNVRVRKTQPWPRPKDLPETGVLTAGRRYHYRYNLSTGSGDYLLNAFRENETVPFATTGSRDGSAQVDNVFFFKVPK